MLQGANAANALPRRPLFSIVMPTYGVERYIARAIECVQAQTFSDWELIVVDDATPDASAVIAERIAADDSRIRVIHHEHNQGISGARNTGLDAARGLYVWIPDPDDRFSPDTLEAVARALADNPAVITLMGSDEVYLDAKGEVVYDHPLVHDDVRCVSAEQLRPLVLGLEQRNAYGYVNTKIYDLDYLRTIGVRFVDHALIEDLEFNVEVFQNAPSFNVLSEMLYRYEKRDSGSLTSAYVPDYYLLHRRRIKLVRDQQESWGLLDERAKSILGALFARYIISALVRSFDPKVHADDAMRRVWLEEVFADELFVELMPYAKADDMVLKVSIVPLKHRNITALIMLARAAGFIRAHSYELYTAAKQSR